VRQASRWSVAHRPALGRFVLGLRRLANTLEILHRELRVHRYDPIAEPQDRVHALTALEPVLQLEMRLRQDLGQ